MFNIVDSPCDSVSAGELGQRLAQRDIALGQGSALFGRS